METSLPNNNARRTAGPARQVIARSWPSMNDGSNFFFGDGKKGRRTLFDAVASALR